MQSFYPNNIAELLSYGKILFFLLLHLIWGVVQSDIPRTKYFNLHSDHFIIAAIYRTLLKPSKWCRYVCIEFKTYVLTFFAQY